MSDQDSTSPLLALPTELRNSIYEFAFLEATLKIDAVKPPKSASLLLTCKQIHNEALLVYYANLTVTAYARPKFVAWAQALSAKSLRLIPEIRYDIDEHAFSLDWEHPLADCCAQESLEVVLQELEEDGVVLRAEQLCLESRWPINP